MDRNRWIAVGLISLGFIMLFGRWFGFFTIVALLLMFAGVLQIKHGHVKKGYILLGVGAVLPLEHLMLIIGISLISLGIFMASPNELIPRRSTFRSRTLCPTLIGTGLRG